MSTFGDRFLYIDNVNEDSVDSAPPTSEIVTMTNMVRRFSVLLKKVSRLEVYQAVTDHSDPEIALILAAAKNQDATFRFANESQIKEFMFGDPTYDNAERNIFVEGIRRISATFAAAELIHAFAQLAQHHDHAEALKNRATAELDRILEIPKELQEPVAPVEDEDGIASKVSFYFDIVDFTFPQDTSMQVYIPGLASWQTVVNYTTSDNLSTALICAQLADAVNALSLTGIDLNIIAGPTLSSGIRGIDLLHETSFYTRSASVSITAELISVRFISTSSSQLLTSVPFKWGVDPEFIDFHSLNSLLLIVKGAHFIKPTAASISKEADPTPIYLYIRNTGTGDPIISSTLRYRLSTLAEEQTLTVSQDDPDERHSLTALAILDSLFAHRIEAKVVGIIIRNDPDSITEATSRWTVLELVSWSVTNPNTFITMDILELPSDIEITLGDYKTIYSPFSQLPRSLRVQSKFYATAEAAVITAGGIPSYNLLNGTPSNLKRVYQNAIEQSHVDLNYDFHWRD